MLTATFSLVPTHPAQAVFPGANGKLAVTITRNGNSEINVTNAGDTNPTRLTHHAYASPLLESRRL